MTGLATEWSWTGAVLGIVLLAGLSLIVAGLPARRRPTLDDRLEPYLRDTPRPSSLLASAAPARGPFGFGELLAPYVARVGSVIERVLGGAPSVVRRQLRAGRAADVERFRAEQVLWGTLGGLAGLVTTGLVAVSRQRLSVPVLVLTTLICVGLGVVLRDNALSVSARRREARMLNEFPTIAELLALAVSAGEGATGALERVCRLSHGELSGELRRCLADARAGANLPTALQGLADRTGLMSLSRFVDGIVVAVERGTPLAEVLRAQAQDVREEGRRSLMAEGGRKEILMMMPVVFLILPVTVLFAVYPGVTFLELRL
ncbi:type II secretion system F family protein [Terracoccus luteus]|jgi:tight adherence protein C|uniref:Tight adherence protein C n=1 Tax=Terracoccus luteus TaxID=53356 RepID=A0A839PNY9_9MICO|nr:type II secretion system F family protein [Terracoccus luteus]MBB2985998.1 tight adherence protein C [Terracoccus luteus]MCP2171650.1 tight adherence protein C [Terracoccus luteus]